MRQYVALQLFQIPLSFSQSQKETPMKKALATIFVILLIGAAPVWACQPCAVYSATELHGFSETRMTIGVSNVFTKYQSNGGLRRPRDGEILREYNTTEISATYDFNKRWSVQASLPIISREFYEFQDFRRRTDNDAGIGDVSLLGYYVPVIHADLDTTFYWGLSTGVKFPTGDTDSLQEAEQESFSRLSFEDSQLAHHVGSVSGIQGRGPTLGSGSFDFPFGTRIFARYKRFFFYGSFQYTVRTEGDYNYQFDDDIVWNAGPAAYLYLGDHDFSIALRAVLSGEDKGDDEVNGETLDNTSISNVYLGPEILITARGRFTGELGVDIPVSTTSSSDALEEPDYRIRAAVGYRF